MKALQSYMDLVCLINFISCNVYEKGMSLIQFPFLKTGLILKLIYFYLEVSILQKTSTVQDKYKYRDCLRSDCLL